MDGVWALTETDSSHMSVDIVKSILLRKVLFRLASLYRRIHIAIPYRTVNAPKTKDSTKSAGKNSVVYDTAVPPGIVASMTKSWEAKAASDDRPRKAGQVTTKGVRTIDFNTTPSPGHGQSRALATFNPTRPRGVKDRMKAKPSSSVRESRTHVCHVTDKSIVS